MTGYESKRAAAQDKLNDDDLTIAYQSGYYDGKKAAQEPVAWATREDFYRELDRRVERMRKEMEIKTVTMRCKEYDLALNIVDMYGGHIVVGQVSFPPQRTEQEPVAWADIQKEAQQIVESKFLWKKFIDGTPLSNDIACWMADFAQQYTAPPQRTWVDLTDEEIEDLFQSAAGADEETHIRFARAIENALRSKNNG